MNSDFDFEQAWQKKLSAALDAAAGEEIRISITSGGDLLSDTSDRIEVIHWTQGLVQRSEALLDPEQQAEVFSACACRYPADQLQTLREAYAADGDLDFVLEELQKRFVRFLSEDLELPPEKVEDVVNRGWGLAGQRQGMTIYATKIPKSGYLQAYLEEPDPERRRAMYCHCTRVRDAVAAGAAIPATYCYCGAGYYKAIWEMIIDQPVRVEVVSSVLAGDDTCTVAIYLPQKS